MQPRANDQKVVYAKWDVIASTTAHCYSSLIEVAFYDNMVELLWVAEHIKQIGDTMADAIISFMQEKNLLTDTGTQTAASATTPNA